MDRDDRIKGAVMGLCVGNALGMPLKNAKSGAIRSAFGTVADYVDARKMLGAKLHRWSAPGLYGSDAQLALALLDSTLENRGFNVERAAALFGGLTHNEEGLADGVLRGASSDVRAAAENHRQGVTWNRAGHIWPGCAPAARIAALALYDADAPHALPDKIIESALLTNRSPMSVSAAAAVAHIILDMLERDELAPHDGKDIVESAAAYSRSIEERLMARYADVIERDQIKEAHIISETLAALAGRLDENAEDTASWICENATERTGIEVKRPTRDVAAACAVYSIYVFVTNPGSFEQAVIAAVNKGAAADAAGAMAGAMAGALHGESGIPERLLKGLANTRQLRARAQALAQRRFPRAQIADFVDMETDLTRKESEEREAVMRKSRKFTETREKKQRREQPKDKPPPGRKIDKKKIIKFKQKRFWEQYLPPEDKE